MSFLNIDDPKERDQIVADYLATVEKLKHRHIDERAQDLGRREDLKQMFEPVTESAGKSAKAVTEELVPIRQELKALSDRLLGQPASPQPSTFEEPQRPNVLEKYLHKFEGTRHLDKYFGIQRLGNNTYEMGTKTVIVDDRSNIIVDNLEYPGTSGLWALVMLNDPPANSYTPNDLRMYRDLVYQTSIMSYPHNVVPGSRYKQTKKWTHVFPLLETVDDSPHVESDMFDNAASDSDHTLTPESSPPPDTSYVDSRIDDDEEDSFKDSFTTADWAHDGEASGSGVMFLPGDIKGLETKLNYLLGEYRAGNTITRNEIVSILDELQRRKRISRGEYREINTFLQC